MRVQDSIRLKKSLEDLTKCHALLRRHLETASEMAQAVVLEHKPPACRTFLSLRRLFLEVSSELQSYLDLEETALIPALSGRNGWQPVTDLAETIRLLRFGQQAILSVLSDICEETEDFETRAEGCQVYGAFLNVLRTVQAQILQQFQLDNETIFPHASAFADAFVN